MKIKEAKSGMVVNACNPSKRLFHSWEKQKKHSSHLESWKEKNRKGGRQFGEKEGILRSLWTNGRTVHPYTSHCDS